MDKAVDKDYRPSPPPTGVPAMTPCALTVATSDCGGGAGVQADLKTFAAHGVHGLSAMVALTAQNPDSVRAIHVLENEFIETQFGQLTNYYTIAAAKTGMLYSNAIIEQVAAFFWANQIPLVVDPVMVASSGATLLQENAIESLQRKLLPCATLVTPNLDEVAVLTGQARPETPEAMLACGQELAGASGINWLIKGGHLGGNTLVDYLILADGQHFAFECERRAGLNTHGSGCTLSAAIAALLARGLELPEAVGQAHAYLQAAMAEPLFIGKDRFIRHIRP